MKLTKANQPPLRRRTKISARVELFRNYCLVLLLFGALVVVFTPPPTADRNNNNSNPIQNDAAAGLTTIVTCEVSTPHSHHPETAARGKFEVAILNEDIGRKGSSAEAFLRLVGEKFYDGCYTFRVIPGMFVQWGHRADNQKANLERIPESDKPIGEQKEGDDTILQVLRNKQNVKGTITMIGGKTGQVFVNMGDNRRLDKEGTLPFGVILETAKDASSKDSGMGLIENIYHDYKGGQGQIPAIGKHQIPEKFPEMGRIDRCYRK